MNPMDRHELYGQQSATPRLLPHRAVLAALAFSFAATNLSGVHLGAPSATPIRQAAHVLVGAACLGAVAYCAYVSEYEIVEAVQSARGRARGDLRHAD